MHILSHDVHSLNSYTGVNLYCLYTYLKCSEDMLTNSIQIF